MRVLLISAKREDIDMATWPLGMVLVAEAVRSAGHETRLLDLVPRVLNSMLSVAATLKWST